MISIKFTCDWCGDVIRDSVLNLPNGWVVFPNKVLVCAACYRVYYDHCYWNPIEHAIMRGEAV